MKKVRVRIAPSPTGQPHVGTAYIALFNYAFAKKHGGDFIIRIEDTDRARFNKESEAGIMKYLKWLGLDWVEGPDIGGPYGPYKQSEREYRKYAEILVDKGLAYRCYCTQERLDALREEQKLKKLPPGYDGRCRNSSESLNDYVIRLKVPRRGKTIVYDELRGNIEFENVKIDDQILLKNDGMPTYHLANVVDDHLMEITHVIRAEEWIPSTPKHALLYEAFGWEKPKFIHMPLLRNDDKSKISKRKNDVSLEFYYNEGFTREAMVNFLALMGWHQNNEIFSLEEFIQNFDLKEINLSAPVFDIAKLKWLNREYLKTFSPKYIIDLIGLQHSDFIEKVVEDSKTEFYTLSEIKRQVELMLSSSIQNFKYDLSSITKFKNNREMIFKFLDLMPNSLNEVEAKEFMNYAKNKLNFKPGELYPALRVASIGLNDGIEIAKLIYIYGKENLIKRVREFDEST